MQKYNLKRPDRGELYRYVMIEHEHESDNLILKEHEPRATRSIDGYTTTADIEQQLMD